MTLSPGPMSRVGIALPDARHPMPFSPAPPVSSPGWFQRLVRHQAAPWVLLALSSIGVLVAWAIADRAVRHVVEARAEARADEAARRVQDRLQRYHSVVRSTVAFARGAHDMSRPRWREYVDGLGLPQALPGTLGLVYAPSVPRAAIATHEARLREDGIAGYEVWPSGDGAEAYPIAYVEPEGSAHLPAVGFDLATDPARRSVLERARDAAGPVLSGRLRLRIAPSASASPAVAFVAPVFTAGRPLGTTEQRQRALVGFVIAPFVASDLLAGLSSDGAGALRLTLREGSSAGPVLHRDDPPASAADTSPPRVRVVDEAGARWVLEVHASDRVDALLARAAPAVVALATLAVNGLLVGWVCTRQSARVRQSGAAFVALAESVRVAILTGDASGRITYANAAAERMFGAPRERLCGVHCVDVVADEDRERIARGLDEFVAGQGRIAAGAAVPITGRRASGETFPAEITLSWFEGAEGRTITAVINDVTDRHEAEQALRAAREQAERAARGKSDFLAMMSHELRTPMNGVLGMANLLAGTPLGDEQREYLDMIGRSGRSLLRLIDDILDFSKIEAGRVVLEQVPCDVGAIADEVVAMLGVQARAKGLQVDARVVPGTPTAVVTDPGRVRQVLFNLVGNAIKFTPAGAVHVTVSEGDRHDGQVTLRFSVTDTGIGIAEDVQRTLFEKFTQADASTTRRFGGTGLGLAISKGLVEGLGGRIGVTSTVGVGSQFWFTIVAPPASSGLEVPAPAAAVEAPVESPPRTGTGAGRRVLVAEDNPVNQRVAVRMLEKLGYVVDVAADGRQAVQMAEATPYVAILMDCHMPELDGFEATRLIRERLGWSVPVLAMTAAGSDDVRERCRAAGMDDFLAKPVQITVLQATLDRVVPLRCVGQRG